VVKLSNSSDNAVDTEGRILEAYVNQCTAEAQEGVWRHPDKYKLSNIIWYSHCT
jgi:hypothetical protein